MNTTPRHSIRSPIRLLVAVLGAAVLAACGGGDDATAPTSVGAASSPAGSASAPATAVHLSGTAATGTPIVGGTVTLVCAGATSVVTTTTGSDGRFSVDVNQTPCLAKVTFGTPAQTLYSMTTTTGVLDISPFTDLVVAAYGHSVPDVFFAAFDPAQPMAIDATALADAIALVKRRIANAGVGIDALDLLHQAFAAQTGDPYDDALEALKATTSAQVSLRADVAAGRDAPPVVIALPTTPEISLVETGDGVARLTWTPVEDATSYVVYYDVVNSGPDGVSFSQTVSATSPFVLTGLTNGTAYVVKVQATNASGSTTGRFLTFTPKASGLVFTACPGAGTGCVDPHYGDGTMFGPFYVAMAYTRYGGQDHYIAVKSNLQIMNMIDDTPNHVDFPVGGANFVALNAVAASEDGVVLAVGDGGLLMLSSDGGNHWSTINAGFAGTTAATTTFTSVAYGDGKFVIAGTSHDSVSGAPRDLIVTYPAHYACPAGASCGAFTGLTAFTPHAYSNLSQVAWGGGRFVALGSGNSYTDSADVFHGDGVASYTSTDGVSFDFNTPTGIDSYYSGADKLFFYGSYFWGLSDRSDTGGQRSVDGRSWASNDWQVTNPGNFINDVTVGINQIVAIDSGGYAYVNKSGDAAKSAWTSSSPNAPLVRTSYRNERNLIVYGHGRYVAISGGRVFVSP